MESRPFLTRIPDQDIIVTDRVATSVPGAGRYQFTSTRDGSGSYAMVYAPVGRPFSVRMSVITGSRVKAWWFNPRTGTATAIGTYANTGQREFTPPASLFLLHGHSGGESREVLRREMFLVAVMIDTA